MACPQPKHHTRVSNELLEALTRFQIPSVHALRVVLWVARKTYGWQKKFTEVPSLTDLSDELKMSRSTLHLAIQVLLDGRVLSRDKDGKLSIQKDYELWIVHSNGQEREESSIGPSKSSIPVDKKSIGLTTYKEKEKKEKKEKQIAPTAALQTGLDSKKPLTGIQKVIRGFKEAKGIDADDAGWDTLHFKRFTRPAKDLLKIFGGNAEAAILYTLKKGEELDSKNLLSWGLEAVSRAAATDPNVLNFMGGGDGSEHKPVVSDSLDGPRSTGRFASSRSLAGDALRAIESSGVRPEETRFLGSDDDDFSGDQD